MKAKADLFGGIKDLQSVALIQTGQAPNITGNYSSKEDAEFSLQLLRQSSLIFSFQ